MNRHVTANGPLRPVWSFLHALQAMYSRSNGGVDTAAQIRSRLNTPGSNVGWGGEDRTLHNEDATL